jgi:hypothetical protein
MDKPDAATPDALPDAAAGTHGVAVQPVIGPDSGSDDEAARWEAAARIRRDHPRWVVIWCARKGEFQARPLFRAPPDAVASGTTPEELIVQMDRIQRASERPRRVRV